MSNAAINIITGIPFPVTFNAGTNTFAINTAGDYTGMFVTNAILTALGGPPNGGYQKVIASSFTGNHTTVTVSSYSTNTAYPGPTTFTAGTGTIIWFTDTAAGSIPYNVLFSIPGTYSWTVPVGVTSISATTIGGGGGSGNNFGSGGGGGANAHVSTMSVTPGDIWTIIVGSPGAVTGNGGDSVMRNAGSTIVITGGGGAAGINGGNNSAGGGGGGGGYGAAGGSGSVPTTLEFAGGVGGTPTIVGISGLLGFGGNGGGSDPNDEPFPSGSDGSAGGGGGGAGGFDAAGDGGGTGVGPTVPGANGAGGTWFPDAGNPGSPGTGGSLQQFGGGGGDSTGTGSTGGGGAIYIFSTSQPTVGPPSNLSAARGNQIVTLTWTASDVPGCTYNVYQGTSSGGESGTPALTGISSTTAVVTSLTNDTTYFFKVAAVFNSMVSSFSNEASATPANNLADASITSGTDFTFPYGGIWESAGVGYSSSSASGGPTGTSNITTVNGQPIYAIGAVTGFGYGSTAPSPIVLVVLGDTINSVPQNFFDHIVVTLAGGSSFTFYSASTDFYNFGSSSAAPSAEATQWAWEISSPTPYFVNGEVTDVKFFEAPTSPWSLVTGHGFTGVIETVAHNGSNLWVAAGTNGQIATSPDGTTWTQQANNFLSTDSIEILTFGNGIWVAGAIAGTSLFTSTSTDGITWTARTSTPFNAASGHGSMVFGGGQFVVFVNSQYGTSPDGVAWTLQTSFSFGNTNQSPDGHHLIFDGVNYVVTLEGPGSTTEIASSTDGINFTTNSVAAGITWSNNATGGIAFSGSLYVVGQGNGTTKPQGASGNSVSTITTPVNFNFPNSFRSADICSSIAYGNGMFVALSERSGASSSSDGITWIPEVLPGSPFNMFTIAYGNSKFVAVGSSKIFIRN